MVVLVPAYEPDARLVTLVQALRRARPHVPVVVVDDGSGPGYRPVFAAAGRAGADVLTHPVNRGKGVALRTGVAHVLARHPGADVVSADCDGQHTVRDVLAVADRVARGDVAVVLGARSFAGDVPLRSRVGNTCTRVAFRLGTGVPVRDTQTGLRGYPADMLPWLLDVPGDRFEYELAVLLRAADERRTVVEVPIATVYLDGNASSHFRPLVDSARVYAPLLRFVASSLAGFAVDAVALLALAAATGSLLAATVGARVLSGAVNFGLNRRWVFRRGATGPVSREAVAYALLAVNLLLAGYAGLRVLTHAGVPLLAAKVVADLVLFLVGYRVQRTAVFRGPRVAPGAAGTGAPGQAAGTSTSTRTTSPVRAKTRPLTSASSTPSVPSTREPSASTAVTRSADPRR